MRIPVDKIRDVIGPGGKMIRSITERTGCKIEIEDDGRVLIASTDLPWETHSDPADRILIATAREYGLRILTRDRKILDYAAKGHVMALPC